LKFWSLGVQLIIVCSNFQSQQVTSSDQTDQFVYQVPIEVQAIQEFLIAQEFASEIPSNSQDSIVVKDATNWAPVSGRLARLLRGSPSVHVFSGANGAIIDMCTTIEHTTLCCIAPNFEAALAFSLSSLHSHD
jgi:hypothetical protein